MLAVNMYGVFGHRYRQKTSYDSLGKGNWGVNYAIKGSRSAPGSLRTKSYWPENKYRND